MEETCTFSRALHLMRYGGKKMRPYDIKSPIEYIFLSDQFGLTMVYKEYVGEVILNTKEIMGSWVEVK